MLLKNITLIGIAILFLGCGENKEIEQESEKNYPNTTTLEKRETDKTLPRPTANHPSIDTVLETKIELVKKSNEQISSYPKVQSWNRDMSLLRIGHRLYNNNLEESSLTKGIINSYNTICFPNADYFRWSNKKADNFFVLNSHLQFVKGSIISNRIDCNQILYDFKEHGYEYVEMGPYEGNIDKNDQYVTFVVKEYNDDKLYILLFDIVANKQIWVKPFNEGKWVFTKRWEVKTLDWVSVSQSGKYIVINTPAAMYRYDINFENRVKLQYRWNRDNKLYSEGGHGDLCYDSNNKEVFVQNIGGVGVYSFNLENPHEEGKELLDSPYGGGHISCRNLQRPGWAYVTREEEGYREVFALRLDGTTRKSVQVFSQTHKKEGYAETYGAPSPDGKQIIFNSHWGSNKIGTFIASDKD
jgi:hypothetical protein